MAIDRHAGCELCLFGLNYLAIWYLSLSSLNTNVKVVFIINLAVPATHSSLSLHRSSITIVLKLLPCVLNNWNKWGEKKLLLTEVEYPKSLAYLVAPKPWLAFNFPKQTPTLNVQRELPSWLLWSAGFSLSASLFECHSLSSGTSTYLSFLNPRKNPLCCTYSKWTMGARRTIL